MFVIVICLLIIAGLTYMIILGSSKSKTEEEMKIEDKMQIEYLNNYKIGGNKFGK